MLYVCIVAILIENKCGRFVFFCFGLGLCVCFCFISALPLFLIAVTGAATSQEQRLCIVCPENEMTLQDSNSASVDAE